MTPIKEVLERVRDMIHVREDEYYTPEGFYEWQSEPEMHWKISAKVTHWMPLIALP